MERDELLQNDSKGYTAGSENPVGSLTRYVFIAFGIFFFAIGAIGTVVPLIPTTPLIILAAVCFGKSSYKLHSWFLSTQLYRKTINGFVKSREMSIKAKAALLTSVTIIMGLSFSTLMIFQAPVYLRIVLAVIWVFHIVYFGFIIKTVRC